MVELKCDRDCLNCPHSDCIDDSDFLTLDERKYLSMVDEIIEDSERPKPNLNLKWVHNRPDKEAYTKARDRRYEQKRAGSPQRRESKRRQYLRYREEKLAYQHNYYEEHREEISAINKSKYEANKEVILQKHKEYYESNREQVQEANKKWKEEHFEQYLEYQREYHRTPKAKESRKRYYEENREVIRERQRAYREAHREEINRRKREAYYRKKGGNSSEHNKDQ